MVCGPGCCAHAPTLNDMEELDSQTSAARGERSALRWLWLPGVFVIVAVGVWITGGVITNDESLAKVLTGLWFALAGLAVLVLAWVRRGAAVPAIIGYSVAAVGIGGFLLYTSTVDQVVDEDVVVAAPEESATASGGDTMTQMTQMTQTTPLAQTSQLRMSTR